MTTVRTNANGYAVGVRCHYDHSGNRGLQEHMRGIWQCQGCSNCVPESQVITAQRSERSGGEV